MSTMYVLFLLVCSSPSLDDCAPAHIQTIFTEKEPCDGTLASIRNDAAAKGLAVYGVCADVKLPGKDA